MNIHIAEEPPGFTPDEIGGGHTLSLSCPMELSERLEAQTAQPSASSR